jgi:SAM-dependent methyltransferase
MALDPTRLADNLVPAEPGLWVSRTAASTVSYPEDGSAACLAIEDGSFWFRHRNRCIVDLVRRFPPAGAVWDLGGGNGYVSRGLAEAGFEVALLEPGRAGADAARRRGLSTVVCATFEDARFRDGSLAACGLFDVLEHVADDGSFLTLLHHALAPGGRLYLTVPAHPWLWSDNDRHSGHLRRYTEPGLRALLAARGFRVDWSSPFFGPLVLPIFLLRSLPGRFGRARAGDSARTARQHAPGGPAPALLGRLLEREARRLAAGGRVAVGSSLLVAASTAAS